MQYTGKIDKAFEGQSAAELQYAPVSALKGVSDNDAIALKKAFGVTTIRDLAELKYAEWATDLCELAKNTPSATLEEYRENLDKKYEKKKASQIPAAPVDALQGLSKADAALLKKAFNIKTVQDLAKLKYIAWAKEISRDAYQTFSQPPQKSETQKTNWLKYLLIALLIAALLFVLYLFLTGKCSMPGKKSQTENTAPAQVQTETRSPEKKPEPEVSEKAEPVVQKDQGDLRSVTEYTITPGDTLVSISEKLYGSYKHSGKLFQANRKLIRKPSEIFPGTKLKVPR